MVLEAPRCNLILGMDGPISEEACQEYVTFAIPLEHGMLLRSVLNGSVFEARYPGRNSIFMQEKGT